MPGFTNVFKSLQIRLPWDKYACQSYLSRFQFSFHISWSTCAARAPYWLRGMWSHDTSWCICSVKGKNPDRNGHEAKIRGTAGSMFQMCVHELIGASVVCYAEGWRDGGKGGGGGVAGGTNGWRRSTKWDPDVLMSWHRELTSPQWVLRHRGKDRMDMLMDG